MTNYRYTAIIIDDDIESIQTTQLIINDFFPNIKVYKTFTNPIMALKELQETHVDLLLLDIKMDGITGIDIAQALDEKDRPYIIFVTGFHDYAIDAIKKGAFDYIVKPLTPINLKETLNRIEQEELLKTLSTVDNNNLKFNRISINRNDKCILIDLDEINRFQAAGPYTHIFLKTDERIIVTKNLKHFDQLVKNRGFVRPHRAHIFNINNIKEIKKDSDGNGIVSFKSGKEIFITQDCKNQLILELSYL